MQPKLITVQDPIAEQTSFSLALGEAQQTVEEQSGFNSFSASCSSNYASQFAFPLRGSQINAWEVNISPGHWLLGGGLHNGEAAVRLFLWVVIGSDDVSLTVSPIVTGFIAVLYYKKMNTLFLVFRLLFYFHSIATWASWWKAYPMISLSFDNYHFMWGHETALDISQGNFSLL